MRNEREIIMAELAELNVLKGPHGESLSSMDYQSLVRLLAVKRAVAS